MGSEVWYSMERTVQCHRCSRRTGYQPYVSLGFATQTKATHCPRCGRPALVCELDYADTLCMDNAGLTRPQALEAMDAVNTKQLHANSQHAAASLSVEAYLSKDMGLAKWPTLQSLTTPLQCQCHKCGGSYIFYRNAPDIQRTPPLYCVWCAAPNVTVTTLSTDEHSFIVLAQVYDIDPTTVEVLYTLWSTKSHLTSFSDYMSSEAVSLVLTAKRKQLLANNQTASIEVAS